MKHRSLIWSAAWASTLSCASLFSFSVNAQDISDRAGKWETTIQFNGFQSEDISANQGSSASIQNDPGFGLGFAYNVSNQLAFGFDFSWRDADYKVTFAPGAGNPNPAFDRTGTLETSNTSLSATYYFSPSRFTPLITANIGRTWVDTNIPDGPPVTACWYDPWWGQFCGPVVPTKSDDYWSYGLGVGLRWDSRGPFFVRGLVAEQWLDVGGEVGTPSFTVVRLDLGVRF